MAKISKTQVETMTADAQAAMNQNVEKVTRSIGEAAQFGQGNVDAMVQSSKIATKAAESMGAEIMAYSKKSYEDGMAAVKDISTSKSVGELIEKQTAYTKSLTEAWINEASKINDLATSAFKAASEPLNARFTAAADVAKSVRA